MPRALTFQFTERETMLLRDAIALSLGGTARLTKADRKWLAETAEHVLLRAVLAPEQDDKPTLAQNLAALADSWEQEAMEPSKREMSNALLLQTVAAEVRERLK